jgi:hypothetical protein
MAEDDKEIEAKLIQASPNPISPIFSNDISVFSKKDIVLLDFGVFAPIYGQGAEENEVTQVARIFLSWDAVEDLSDQLLDAIKESKKTNKNKKRNTNPR